MPTHGRQRDRDVYFRAKAQGASEREARLALAEYQGDTVTALMLSVPVEGDIAAALLPDPVFRD